MKAAADKVVKRAMRNVKWLGYDRVFVRRSYRNGMRARIVTNIEINANTHNMYVKARSLASPNAGIGHAYAHSREPSGSNARSSRVSVGQHSTPSGRHDSTGTLTGFSGVWQSGRSGNSTIAEQLTGTEGPRSAHSSFAVAHISSRHTPFPSHEKKPYTAAHWRDTRACRHARRGITRRSLVGRARKLSNKDCCSSTVSVTG
mmetsp:Transcript_32986/g.92342  ORF Transcript_32986/g.92342 Transcript_32986/m.92342 type:complete len:202 (+) Transcript_32986:1060-1665(+)